MHSRLSGATALALLLCASSPAAALTPEEAWAAWQAISVDSGQTITASGSQRNGDTLVVSNIASTMTVPDGPVLNSLIPEVKFRDRGDGSVEITLPPSYEIKLTAPAEDRDGSSATLVVGQEALVTIASGTAEAPVLDFEGKSLSLTAKDIKDAEGNPQDLNAVLTINAPKGKYSATPGDKGTGYDAAFEAADMVVTLKGKPDDQSNVDMQMTIAQPKVAGTGMQVGNELMQAGNLAAALQAGFLVDASYSTGAIAFKLDATEGGKPGHVEGGLTGTQAHVKLDATRMDYGLSTLGGQFTASGFDIPMPSVNGGFAELGYSFAVPVAKSDEPKDFSAAFRMVDLTMTEELWNMFDPGGALKRDPVTLILDLVGTGAWTVDILDPNVELDGPDLPAKLFTLDLKQVLAKFAGAQVAAVGGLTFDNDNLAAYGGFPAPEGKITVTLDGINALLDALVAIGVVSQDDLMGARMGLAMMAKPGAGPDQLISEIEFREGGQLIVNGTQLQ